MSLFFIVIYKLTFLKLIKAWKQFVFVTFAGEEQKHFSKDQTEKLHQSKTISQKKILY